MSSANPASVAEAKPASSRSTADVERDIEQTRERLSGTLTALAAKADVRKQARGQAQRLAGQLRARASQQPGPLAAAAGVVALGVALVVVGSRLRG